MSDEYDGGDSYDGGESSSVETSSESTSDSAEESSAFESSGESTPETDVDVNAETSSESDEKNAGEESSAFKDGGIPQNGENKEAGSDKTEEDKNAAVENKGSNEKQETDYSRPTHWRSGMRDEVWQNAKDEHGRVRDPVTGRYMSKDQAWDMGHKPGYEFYKHQESAKERGISRQEFLDEYYNSDHYRPELPSSNRSHKGENVTDDYFGD